MGMGYLGIASPRLDVWEEDPETGIYRPTGFTSDLNLGSEGGIEFQPQSGEPLERTSTRVEDYGALIETSPMPGSMGFSVSFDEIMDDYGSLRILAATLAGTAESFEQAASSDAAFLTRIYAADRARFVGYRNLIASSSAVHKVSTPATGAATGIATGGTATTLAMTGAGWTEDDLIGDKVLCYEGTGAGQIAAITANDAASVTVASWPTATPDTTTRFAIIAATALAEGTAYTLDANSGMLKPLAGGGISAGDQIAGIVGCRAISGKTIIATNKAEIIFSLDAECRNKEKGERGRLYVPKVSASTSEIVAIANGEYTRPVLAGKVQSPTWDDLRELNWHEFRRAAEDGGANLWGAGDRPTSQFVFNTGETRATT